MTTLHALAASSQPPAGGAAIGQVVGATTVAILLTLGLAWVGFAHRRGRPTPLGRVADWASRISGMPAWVALPAGLAGGSLICAVFGLYWDVSLHIDNGRDPGPLANPAHYFILAGLFGIFAAGWFAIVLPRERPGRAAVRIGRDWWAPVGGLMMMATSSFALLGFPLDDMWHRLFGQDVTLWGPTHMIMLTGAALTLLGIQGLIVEGQSVGETPPANRLEARLRGLRLVSACGGILIGLSIYQGEFDFGVPQFRLLFEPVLIAFAAGGALIAARMLIGRGGALGAVAFFLLVRGTLSLLVGPVLGETTPHFPLYIAEALAVEGAAFAFSPTRRPYPFAVVAGVLIGTVGTLAEWGWSHVWMPLPWPGHIVAEAILLAIPAGVAGGLLGTFFAGGLRRRRTVAGQRWNWLTAGGAAVAVAAIAGFLLSVHVPDGRVTTRLATVTHGAHRTVDVTARFDPPGIAKNADWLTLTAWQGHGHLVVEKLHRDAGGTWRGGPVPVTGSWKTVLRLHRGDAMGSIPVYMPADPAIPVAGIPADARSTRTLVGDHNLLQRERKKDVPGWIWAFADVVVLAVVVILLGLLGWALARLARTGEDAREHPLPPRTPSTVKRRPAAVA